MTRVLIHPRTLRAIRHVAGVAIAGFVFLRSLDPIDPWASAFVALAKGGVAFYAAGFMSVAIERLLDLVGAVCAYPYAADVVLKSESGKDLALVAMIEIGVPRGPSSGCTTYAQDTDPLTICLRSETPEAAIRAADRVTFVVLPKAGMRIHGVPLVLTELRPRGEDTMDLEDEYTFFFVAK